MGEWVQGRNGEWGEARVGESLKSQGTNHVLPRRFTHSPTLPFPSYLAIVDGAVRAADISTGASSGMFSIVRSIKRSTTAFKSFVAW